MKDLSKCKYIAIDFDDTIVKSDFPDIIGLQPDADVVIKALYSAGKQIMIWTCREGEELEQAKQFLAEEEIPYHYINENHPDLMAMYGNNSRKLGADVYIDDKGHTTEKIVWADIFKQFIGGKLHE
ncbi:HAD-like domain containing protein [Enterococcus phage EfsSzw-1]|uniref:HAD-like domain containing protein n=1 Tax=Enterococcus phage EfsSzw-1 TaxID=2419745 RepID=A0A411B7E5_9CAUD|nr:HAD-like domain containing protein [Enterococcus phage EfsSzw-1]